MSTPPPEEIQYLDLVKVAGSEVEPAEVEDWIRRQLH